MARRHRTRSTALPRPPVGTYDPSIDASERAAGRGYRDLQTDTATAGTRAASDYGIGLEDIGRQRDYGLADILRGKTRAGEDINIEGAKIGQDYSRGVEDVNRGYGRNLADLLSTRTRAGEDYHSNIATLDRNYVQLGGRQGQATAAAGASGGGALAQALQKRTANEAIDRAPIDTGYNRFTADSALSEGRLGEDKATSLTRLGENRDQAVSALDLSRTRGIEDFGTQSDRLTTQLGTGESTYKPGTNAWADAWLAKNPGKQLPGTTDNGLAGQQLSLGYQRGGEDRSTALRRGGRELNAYSQDLIPVRYYSAAGLTPYTPPKRKRR